VPCLVISFLFFSFFHLLLMLYLCMLYIFIFFFLYLMVNKLDYRLLLQNEVVGGIYTTAVWSGHSTSGSALTTTVDMTAILMSNDDSN